MLISEKPSTWQICQGLPLPEQLGSMSGPDTGDSFPKNTSLKRLWVQESVPYICIPFAALHVGLSVGWPERVAQKHIHGHTWTSWLVQVLCMEQGTQSRCSGTTQRDRLRRGFRGEGTHVTCGQFRLMYVWQRPSQYCKVIILKLK